MKRIICLLVIVSVLAIAAAVSVKPVILFFAHKQLGKVFAGSTVSLEGCGVSPLREIRLFDTQIKKDGSYAIAVKEIDIRYSLASVLKRNILKIVLKDAAVGIDLPKESILEFRSNLNPGPPGVFSIKDVALSDLRLDVASKDLNLKARVSVELDLENRAVQSVDLRIASLQSRNFRLKNGSLSADRQQQPGRIAVENIQYEKVKAGDIKGTVRLEDNDWILDPISAQTFNGNVTGHVTLKAGLYPEYLATLEFVNLDLARIVNDLELDKKFEMSGSAGGRLVLSGRGTDLSILSGSFSMAETGGVLIIHDTRFLKNIARRSKQPLDILVESFKNYHYNNGIIRLSLDEDRLVMDVALDGETGKRDLNITVHDFQPKKDPL